MVISSIAAISFLVTGCIALSAYCSRRILSQCIANRDYKYQPRQRVRYPMMSVVVVLISVVLAIVFTV